VHLLGHSHGGFVAQRYAIHHPDRVASLVSYSSSPRWDAEVSGDAGKQLSLMAERLPQRQEMSAIIAAWNSGFEPTDEGFTAFFRTILPAYFADYWINEERLRPLRESIPAWVVRGGLAPFDDRGALRDLRTPTLIVVGEYDFICGPQWGEETRVAIPSSQLVNLRCGHMSHLEEADLFSKTIVEFVTSLGN
jgi:proline iminopeptidase